MEIAIVISLALNVVIGISLLVKHNADGADWRALNRKNYDLHSRLINIESRHSHQRKADDRLNAHYLYTRQLVDALYAFHGLMPREIKTEARLDAVRVPPISETLSGFNVGGFGL